MAKILLQVTVFAFLALYVSGQPISPQDVEGLLPQTPRTKNETVAAIIQDPVVKDAVQSVVGDGTLSGLVVKKDTVILPARTPDVVLSYKQQILMAPLSDLENIRKNITEAATLKAEKEEKSEDKDVEELGVVQVVPVDDREFPDPPIIRRSVPEPEKQESTDSSQTKTEVHKLEISGIEESAIKLPEGVFPENISLPEIVEDKISDPVVAVVREKILPGSEKSVLTLSLAAPTESGIKKSDTTAWEKKEIPEYGARIPVAVIMPEESENQPVDIEARSQTAKEILAIFTVSGDESSLYQSDSGDMAVAEDIIFRPLFRYRQQQNDRTRVLENRVYYQKTPLYRGYRPPYASTGDYGAPYKSYRRRQRPRYYEDY
ncbi:uncharacterized protein LOC107227465 isoform X1 [Neodiprion lecontei]|uniref:Uncharacterized protein LOC107227465 isoform X1 n=1 Tax=Neodiprion lecontei TaxID=441921 RepID=A0ABM3GCY6_NEOLC|nr:uncharacterized protein LOC107227465 isoform X1 [Neodiprion lecontei]